MRRYLTGLISLCFVLIGVVPIFSGCQTNYPDSALFVGKGEKYETIQSAIDASSKSGQYIVVKSGSYKENLFISKTVKIVGKSNSVTLNVCKTMNVQLKQALCSLILLPTVKELPTTVQTSVFALFRLPKTALTPMNICKALKITITKNLTTNIERLTKNTQYKTAITKREDAKKHLPFFI